MQKLVLTISSSVFLPFITYYLFETGHHMNLEFTDWID